MLLQYRHLLDFTVHETGLNVRTLRRSLMCTCIPVNISSHAKVGNFSNSLWPSAR